MYHVLQGNVGNVRESYVACMWMMAGHKIFSSHRESSCDFSVTLGNKKLTLEVGGKNKKAKQADLVIRDDIDVPSHNVIPLWLLGMMC